MTLRLQPITLREANEFVRRHHRDDREVWEAGAMQQGQLLRGFFSAEGLRRYSD